VAGFKQLILPKGLEHVSHMLILSFIISKSFSSGLRQTHLLKPFGSFPAAHIELKKIALKPATDLLV
jgi:hypothetical protein